MLVLSTILMIVKNSFFGDLILTFTCLLFSVAAKSGFAQESHSENNFAILKPGSSEDVIAGIAAGITPSSRQLAWQRLATTAFIHFGINTFYNQEWGSGKEDPGRFNPKNMNTDQWAKVISESGFKMLIMTCKHHDGFCLWPSKFTNHTVEYSPWLQGKGDVVKQVSESCRKYNLKFGIYLSPWDRHEPSYGNSPEYNTFFLNQLAELLSNYGTVDEVWFDGACGEGQNGKKQIYDWAAYYALIRKLQPNAVIAVMGPDVRWVGTESGYGRETEWSVVPYQLTNQENIAANSQQYTLNEGFIPPGNMMNQDLGSRQKIKEATSLIWYPSEVDVSIRPGWFWHEGENQRVKTPEKLLDIYFSSIGRNSQLLLNIPPDSTGLINEADIRSIQEWHTGVEAIFRNNLVKEAKSTQGFNDVNIQVITDHNDSTSWNPTGRTPYTFELEFNRILEFDVLLLQEKISEGQHIEHFKLEVFAGNGWKQITEGTTIGYKRLLRFPIIKTKKVRFTIDQSRLEPHLAEFGLYRQLPVIKAIPAAASFIQSVEVELSCNENDAGIYYTTDGSQPDFKSQKYYKPIKLEKSTQLRYIGIRKDGTSSFIQKSDYQKAKHAITLLNAPDEKYNAGGSFGLVDGMFGSDDFADGHWCGFSGKNLEAIIDLGSVKALHELGINFLVNTKSWIFPPQHLEFEVSTDGKEYKNIFTKSFENIENEQNKLLQISFNNNCKARFVKVKALNYGTIPHWHPGNGEPAWLFTDEITID
jgi:alpha-L-fucosidase